MRDGSTSLVAILYARMLWEVTARRPEADVAGLRDMAVLAMLYAYGAITVDGQRCGDATASPHRRQQILALSGIL